MAASILTAAYHMLKNGVEYEDLTDSHFDRRDHTKLVKRLEGLGLAVTTTPMRHRPRPNEFLSRKASGGRA